MRALSNSATQANHRLAPSAQGTSGTQQPDRKKWRGRSIRLRLRIFDRLWVDSDLHAPILQAVDELIATVNATGKSRGMLVICESGGGKSAMCRQLRLKHKDIRTTVKTTRQLVLMPLPARMTQEGLTKVLLKCLGDPAWDARHNDRFGRAIELLHRCGVKLVVVDNFQDIPERRSRGQVRVVGNWFRDLLDRANVAFVAFGTEPAREVRRANDQVRRRISSVRTVKFFSSTTQDDLRIWQSFLEEVSNALPLAEDSKLQSARMASKLFYASNGIPDYLFKLLASAIRIAVGRGGESLTAPDLKAAYEEIAGEVTEHGNPFADTFVGRTLDGVNELFYRMEALDKEPGGKKSAGSQ